jgi:hypothetical protein
MRRCGFLLEVETSCLAGRMPLGLLPIADTGGGDQFCLWLVGEERGAVVLWDHEAEHRPPTHANLHRVAPSFAAFLELLGDPCDDEPLLNARSVRQSQPVYALLEAGVHGGAWDLAGVVTVPKKTDGPGNQVPGCSHYAYEHRSHDEP